MTGPGAAEEFQWDEGNEGELAQHHITPTEVHEVWEDAQAFVPNRRHRAGDWKMLGRTAGGRRLTIVLRFYDDQRLLRPITGWECTQAELSRYWT